MKSFQTSKGSSYMINSNGTTRRYKVKHVGHDATDIGWKNSSELTVYISKAACQYMIGKLNSLTSTLVIVDGYIQIAYQKDNGKWSWCETRLQTTNEPEVDRHPVEFWGLESREYGTVCNKYHVGNSITAINQ